MSNLKRWFLITCASTCAISSAHAITYPYKLHREQNIDTHQVGWIDLMIDAQGNGSLTDSWTNRRLTPEGRELLLEGPGRRPSDEQVQLWWSIEARLPELTSDAVAVVQGPPRMPRKCVFARDELSLREVRLGAGDSFEFYFDTPLGDKMDMWPVVSFSDWNVRAWEWTS